MTDLINLIIGEELFALVPPEIQVLTCLFIFVCLMWLVVRIFKALGMML